MCSGMERRGPCVWWPAQLMLTQKPPFQRALHPWVICGSKHVPPVESHSLVYQEPQGCISQCRPKTERTASGGGELPLTGGVQAKAE